MTDSIIQVRALRKVYHTGEVDVEALRGVDLDVARGEFLAVIGPSGSGKSTLFHVLGGLAAPTSGSVMIDGADLSSIGDRERTKLRQRKIGFIFQKYNLLPTLSAADNIAMARALAGFPPEPANFAEILQHAQYRPSPFTQTPRPLRRRAAARRHCSRAGEQTGHPARR